MAKKEDVQGTGKPAAGGKESEVSAGDIKDSTLTETATNIETAEDLEVAYPQLVQAVRDEVVEQIGRYTAGQLKGNLPELYERIVMEIQGKSGPNLNVPGFLLEVDDPVAAGTLRAYQRLKGVDRLNLPYVLPYKDKDTKAALENYILRAEGCCDTKRAAAAREAMKKVK
ncbi:hypothetical protein ES703_21012 [subsurface metagenome]